MTWLGSRGRDTPSNAEDKTPPSGTDAACPHRERLPRLQYGDLPSITPFTVLTATNAPLIFLKSDSASPSYTVAESVFEIANGTGEVINFGMLDATRRGASAVRPEWDHTSQR
jgi:hypothetical protein